MTTFTGKSRLGLLLGLAGVLILVASQARADEEKDPPTRVARISHVDGSVSLQPGGQGDWVSAGNSPVRTASTTSFKKLPVPTASTAGPLSATAKKTTRPPRATYRATWSVMTTSTTTAPGVMSLNTATFGIPLRSTPDGLLTAMAIGTGLGRGAG